MKTRKREMVAVTELALSLGLLIRRLRSEAPSESRDFSWTQTAVLSRLEKEGATTTANLARAEGIKPQSMGSVIVTLEKLDLVERRPHATDGRQMMVALTTKGAAMRKIGKDAKRTWLANAIAKLEKRDQKTLFAAGDIIKRLVEL